MKKLLLIICLFAVTLSSCDKRHTKHNVTSYKEHRINDAGLEELIYWYVILSDNNTYYYYSSPTPVSNYSSISWSKSSENPLSNVSESELDKLAEETVTEQELSQDMQQEIDENPDNFEGMSENEMGDYEGTDYNDGGSDGGDFGGGDFGGGGE